MNDSPLKSKKCIKFNQGVLDIILNICPRINGK